MACFARLVVGNEGDPPNESYISAIFAGIFHCCEVITFTEERVPDVLGALAVWI